MSTYINFDHAGWLENQLDYYRRKKSPGKSSKPIPEKLNAFQRKVVNIVGTASGGIYNAPICQPDRIDWNYGTGVSLTWMRELATWDSNTLTLLVFLCHEARIRMEIASAGPRMLRLSFWPREDTGGIAHRHPDLKEAMRDLEAAPPLEHPIRYGKPDVGLEKI